MLTVYVLTYNEEFMLPFFIKHYRSRFPDCHIVVCDNYSTDNTVSIAKSNNCAISFYNSDNTIRDDYYIEIKNNIWRRPSGIWSDNHLCTTEWCAVVDCDEFVDITPDLLVGNIIRATGYDMWGEDGNIDNIDSGVLTPEYCKICFWKPSAIYNIGYCPGAHIAYPNTNLGHTLQFNEQPINLYHYKYISLEYVKQRHKLFAERLSNENKLHGWSFHYSKPCEEHYNYLKENKIKIKP